MGLETHVQSNALEVHVSALRRKLGRELIETVRGLGYRMVEPK
jgi:two-component system OmpR family response regulator